MGIAFQSFECGHIFFLLIFLNSFITTIFTKKYYRTNGISSSLFHIYILTISDLCSVFFFFITKLRTKKEKNKDIKNIKRSKNDIKLISKSREPINESNLLIRTFIVALSDLLANISVFFYYLYVEINSKERILAKFHCFLIFNIVSKYIFSRVMLKIYFHRHHCLSFGIIILSLLFLCIIDHISIKDENYYSDTINICINIFVYLFRNIIFSFEDVIGKKALDEDFLSPYSLLLLRGIFKAIMLLTFSIPLYFIPINGHNIIKEIRNIFEGPIDILKYGIYIVINLSYNIFLWIIIDKYTPNHLAVANILEVNCPLFFILIFERNKIDWKFYLEIGINFILIIGALIHCEIILIKFCGFDENTKIRYNQKSIEDLRQCIVDANEDISETNEDERTSINSNSFQLINNTNKGNEKF